MKWEVQNNTISKLYVKERNLIHPWGIETADSSAFFSLEDGFGYRYSLLGEEKYHDDKTFRYTCRVEMQEGSWDLFLYDRIIDNSRVLRTARLLCLKDSYFMDFVMRFCFHKHFFPKAQIAGYTYHHRNTNVYYQYPTSKVSLNGESEKIIIHVQKSSSPEQLKPHMYVRDNNQQWVVHARMLPTRWEKEVIKLCNNWAQTRPLPQCLSNLILSSKKAKKALWYRGERSPFTGKILKRINPAAFPMVLLKKGQELYWQVEMEVQNC